MEKVKSDKTISLIGIVNMGFIGWLVGFIWLCTYWESASCGFWGGVLGCIIGVSIWAFIGGIIGLMLPVVDVVQEQKIFALSDSSSIQGARYVFSGYMNERLVYRYVTDTEKGKHIEEVSGWKVYINEGDYLPMVKIHTTQFKRTWFYWFAHDIFHSDEDYVEFFVPKNTIISEYNIDLK